MTNNVDTAKWRSSISRLPEYVEEEYDRISTCYDKDMMQKGYQAPKDAAEILDAYIPVNGSNILDVGCGTGLVGANLSRLGFTSITGMDISARCLEQAEKKGVYLTVVKQNILEPFPFEDNQFDAVTCVGVCSRFDDEQILALVGEFGRVLNPDGVILISHRDDLMKSSKLIEKFRKNGCNNIHLEKLIKSYPYITRDIHYEGINVHYMVLRKTIG